MNVWITALDGRAMGATADFTEQEKSRSTTKREVGGMRADITGIYFCTRATAAQREWIF